MLSLWFYPSWLPSRHSSCPLAPHKRGQKAISFQQTMRRVGARVPLLGFLDSQTEYCIIVDGVIYSIITITLGTKWVTLFSFLRLIEALSKFRQGTAFKVSKLEIFKLLLLNFETTTNQHIFICIFIFLFVMFCIFSGFWICLLSKQGWPNSSVFNFETTYCLIRFSS